MKKLSKNDKKKVDMIVVVTTKAFYWMNTGLDKFKRIPFSDIDCVLKHPPGDEDDLISILVPKEPHDILFYCNDPNFLAHLADTYQADMEKDLTIHVSFF